MEITLRRNLSKRIALVVEVVVFLVLASWITRACVADLMARKIMVPRLQLAIKLDPQNALFQWQLARLFQYTVADINPEQAATHLKRAIELSPRDPQAWLDLAAGLEFQSKTNEAEASLRRADFLAPRIPAYQWAIGNSYLLHGNVDQSFRHFKKVLEGSTRFNPILFDTAWKASEDGQKILEEVIPQSAGAESDYLYYLFLHGRYPEAQALWHRILAEPEMVPFKPAADYIENLILSGRPADAFQVWADLEGKGVIPKIRDPKDQNLLRNGDFEHDLLNLGFDWRIVPVEGVFAGLDQASSHSASHAVLIQFPGNQNVNYRNFFQYVKVEPGRAYKLTGFMKTDGITTDSGPRLEVRDPYNLGALAKFSDSRTGTTPDWKRVTLDFTTRPGTELIVVGISRLPSPKIDNQIAGKVWVDDLTLTLTETARRSD